MESIPPDSTRELAHARPGQSLGGWIALAELCSNLFDRPRESVALGRYLVVDKIGAGGMGVVYRAYDPEMDRRVAIKILPTRADAMGAARLLAEARAVAGVSHPNVVAVYDVGTYGEVDTDPDGAGLFMVMELVEGVDADTWLQSGQRTWREVLDAFVQAGHGLAAVHAAELVHGDVKPSNVVVGDDARVRLLDFGLARAAALDRSTVEARRVVTGTPAFMAPEQHRGEAIDARADQFAWCVSLFRGLYGGLPFAGETAQELERAKRTGAIADAPHTRVPAWIRRVLVRGLAARPDDRFPDMTTLLAELARASNRQRRRTWAVAGVIGGGIVVGALALDPPASGCPGEADWHASWDEDDRREVRAALLSVGSPLGDDAATRVQQHLDAYADAGARMHRAVCDALRDGSVSDAIVDRRMVCLRRRLAELHAATEILENADTNVVEHAIEVALGPAPIEQCADDARLAASQPSSSPQGEAIRDRLAAAYIMTEAGRYSDGLALARAAQIQSETLADPWVVAEVLYRLGELEGKVAQNEDAVRHLSEAALGALEIGHDEIVASASAQLVFVLGAQLARTDEAMTWARHAEAAIERIGPGGLEEARWRGNRGIVLFDRGETRLAIEDLRRALEIRTRLLGPDHPNVAVSLNNLGTASESLGDFEEARRYHEQALEVRERVLGPQHPHLAASLTNLGATLWSLGEDDRAQAMFERALALARASLGPEHPTVGQCITNIGVAMLVRDRFAEALPPLTEALAFAERNLPPDHPEIGRAHVRVAAALAGLHEHEQAIAHHERALAIFEGMDTAHPERALSLSSLAASLRAVGRTEEARRRDEESAAVSAARPGADTTD